ncbi:hypothetical protein A6P39_023510 [Streptomyces sp. FXJ1.172]|uniref:hypothetical protein n=1 Tax=Streptomyces sp. FXJ1.172 TaxID=710705 RepID=UPI000B2A871D|nr:hypothetical protein [Streptomyces sp. FXJ1.172]WEO96751.1 hypothetical protein A6P39_023510 [Streptomyces sp. FXJ1.172]
MAFTLPSGCTARQWRATWVGFDVLLVLAMASTPVLGRWRHRAVVVAAVATGALLVCDAWFDVSLVPRQATFARQGAASGACSRCAGRMPSYWTYLGFRAVRRVGAPPGRRLGERAGRRDGANVACWGTSLGTPDVWLSAALAVFVEPPLGGFLIRKVLGMLSLARWPSADHLTDGDGRS